MLFKARVKRRDVLRGVALASAGALLGPKIGAFARGHLSDAPAPEESLAAEECEARQDFREKGEAIYQKHWTQTADTVRHLNRKYSSPSIGKMSVYDACEQLAFCYDETDYKLWNTSQLIHILQVVEGMERENVGDSDLLLCALLHDLGKILLLHGEAPENVVCVNRPIGEFEPGCGLDNLFTQWNHDEFIYLRMRDHVPPHVAWLLRYHSIDIQKAKPYMSALDNDYRKRYLVPFRKYDVGTKSAFHLPAKSLADYREFLYEKFPKKIAF